MRRKLENISFDNPIKVMSLYATETQYGLLKPIKTSIRPKELLTDKTAKMDEAVASEEAISVEINNTSISSIEGRSLSPDGENNYHLFKEIDPDTKEVHFKSLLFLGELTSNSNNSQNTIKTFNTTVPAKNTVYTNTIVNGGSKCKTLFISYRDFVDSVFNELNLFDSFTGDIILGKIEIKIIEPFSYSNEEDNTKEDDSLSLLNKDDLDKPIFSIGTNDENQEDIIKNFEVINEYDYNIGIEYGNQYENKNCILDQSQYPKLYKQMRKLDSVGSMQISIYYDELMDGTYPHNKNILIVGGRNQTNQINSVEKLSLDTITHSSLFNSFADLNTCGGYCTSVNHYIFSGMNRQINTQYIMDNTIKKLSYPDYTISTMEVEFTKSKGSFGFCQYREESAYIFGGFLAYNENILFEITNEIDKFDISTETPSTLSSTLPMILSNCSATNNFIDDSEMYIINGRISNDIPDGLGSFSNKMLKFKTIPSVTHILNNTTLNYSDSPLVHGTVDKIIIAGGVSHYDNLINNSGNLLFQIEEFNQTTDTLTIKKPQNLSIGRGFGSLNSNFTNEKLYFIGGGDINIDNIRTTEYIDILNLVVDTMYVANKTFLMEPRVGHNGVLN
jgi:hypothetical protein